MENTIKKLKEANPQNFEEFFPLYLEAHSSVTNRRLHFIGTTLGLLLFPSAYLSNNYMIIFLSPVIGYGFAWIGHFYFESNIPATYSKPLWSFRGDFRMYGMMLRGKLWN